ncbi:hypothetical protein L1987_17651 [Smallanthus sonchifolius]|uniref:Uncharacterized protein n=1 Tax=Smallanthus sonchifolius TaxID=185202 RepID=A0ACB9IZ19_9ASTR|nr:hypothetical protein L1987_17651 [Smallanthus sonchifolius]
MLNKSRPAGSMGVDVPHPVKDITKMETKGIMLNAQWFYRPEDAAPRNGKKMEPIGARELFYSFHKDEVPAETIMHKCTVHFVTSQNHIQARKDYPGFIVQRVYDPNSNRLLKLANNGFLHEMQEEIDLLVQKTMRRLGILSDAESIDHAADQEDHLIREHPNHLTSDPYRESLEWGAS